jgi:hypothetical protein
MRIISVFFCVLLTAVTPAYAGSPVDAGVVQAQVDCEDARQASLYEADFDGKMKTAVDAMKARELAFQKRYENLKNQIIATGIWDEQAANTFMLNFAVSDPETASFQSKRNAAAKEGKILMYAIAGLPIIAGDDPAARKRGLCILGQKALAQIAIVSDSSAAAWSRVNDRVIEFGKEKRVQGL